MAVTTVDQAQGFANTTEEMVEQYRGIPVGKLKASTRKKLNDLWTEVCKGFMEYEPNVTSVEMLGDDFLIQNTRLFWKGYFEAAELVTLGELAETRETEQESQHLQFEVQLTRVEKLLTDKDDGLLNGVPLMQPIVCMRLPNSDQFVIVSGRHRLSALLTACQVISGYEEFQVPVIMFSARNKMEVVSYVRTANGSRNMTQTEKSMIEGAANGLNLSVYRDVDELFADALKADNLTQLKKFNRSIWGSALTNTVVDADCSINGIGDIGNAVLNQIARRLKDLQKGADKILLEQEGSTIVYEPLIRKAIEFTASNWNTIIKGEFQEVKRLRGVEQLDENNQPIMLFNPSRKATPIGKFIANQVADKFAEHLAQAWKQVDAQKQAAKDAKKAKKAKSSINSDIKQIDNLLQLMQQAGTLTPEVKEAMLKQRAELVQQVADEAAAKAEAEQTAAAPDPTQLGVDPNALF